ncbi:MAG: glycosyltransferase family 4 protein [Dermabacter sp.]|nr:glycosyltransferase family 4 protein [Dermabacter sp.]
MAERDGLDRRGDGNAPAAGSRAAARLEATITALLERADQLVEAGRIDEAVPTLVKVFELTHHVALRDDPTRFLHLLRSSSAIAVLEAQSAPRAPDPVSGPGPVKLLVLAHRSFGFVDRVLEVLEEAGMVEVRRADLADAVPGYDLSLHGLIRRRLSGELADCPEALRPHVQWADTVFVEWGHHALAWASTVDLGRTRLVARLHRFEAFTPFPLLVDYARLDTLVFVSEHMRALVRTLIPHLDELTQTVVISNAFDASAFDRPKLPEAAHTMILVGWNRPVKDVRWAIEVLRRVRAEDPEYRLLLAGTVPDNADLLLPADLREAGAIEVLGERDDMPEVFRRAGVVLSSSLHEGTHESVAEGAASGALPVVRDWPLAVPYGGAGTVYPASWIVPDPARAAARILRAARGTEGAGAAGHSSLAADDWSRGSREPAAIVGAYTRVLRGQSERD